MIKLPGVLIIRVINGRHGEFRVGRLLTDIGEFAVKDPVFDQYDEGQYDGDFVISKIYASSYSAANRLVVEVRAVLESVALATADIQQQEQEAIEQDPIDEEKPLANRQGVPKTQDENESTGTDLVDSESDDGNITGSADETETELSNLFGLLWPLTEQVKLDPTVDRELFRQQRDKLKALDYKFKPVGQLWIKD